MSHVLPNTTLYFITPLCLSQYYTSHALCHPQLYRLPRLGWFRLSWMHGRCIAAQPHFLCVFWKPAGLGRDPRGTSLNGELIICTGFSSLHRWSSLAGCDTPEPTRWCWDYGQYLTRHLLFRHRGHTSPKCCPCIRPSCSNGHFLLAPHIHHRRLPWRSSPSHRRAKLPRFKFSMSGMKKITTRLSSDSFPSPPLWRSGHGYFLVLLWYLVDWQCLSKQLGLPTITLRMSPFLWPPSVVS